MKNIKDILSFEIVIPSIKINFKGILFFMLLIYIVWEACWYFKADLAFIKWHTHIMAIFIFWYTIILFLKLITNREVRNRVYLLLTSIMLCVLITEAFLIITGINKTYMEKRNSFYYSIEAGSQKEIFAKRIYSRIPNEVYTSKCPEFSFKRNSNSYGFSDLEFKPKSKKILIQTYGDSFTEGDGAPFDSSYPAILRDLLKGSIELQNYGLSGNDPGFYVDQFNKVGKKFNPDLIILSYSKMDFTYDFLTRGGLDRINESKKGPWWEFIYAISYTSRIFFHIAGYEHSNSFLNKSNYKIELKKLEPKWNEVFVKIFKIAKDNNCKILLVKRPDKSEIIDYNYDYDFTFFEKQLDTIPFVKVCDLLPYYRDSVGMINETETAKYFWVQDGHHNAKGYNAMAKGVYNGLRKNYPEIFM